MAHWQLAWTSCLSALGPTSSLAEVVIHNPEWVDETSTKSQGSGNDMRPHDNTQLVCNIYHANVFHRRRLRDCIWTAHVAGWLACLLAVLKARFASVRVRRPLSSERRRSYAVSVAHRYIQLMYIMCIESDGRPWDKTTAGLVVHSCRTAFVV